MDEHWKVLPKQIELLVDVNTKKVNRKCLKEIDAVKP